MPELSRFLGIVIAMYYRDQPGHFHAYYGEFQMTVTIETGVVDGQFPCRALRHVLDWYDLHRQELQANWERARRREELLPIEPLE